MFFGQLSSCIYTCIHIFYSTIYFHNILRVKALGSKTISSIHCRAQDDFFVLFSLALEPRMNFNL